MIGDCKRGAQVFVLVSLGLTLVKRSDELSALWGIDLCVVILSSILYQRQPTPPFTRLPSTVVATRRRISNGLSTPRASMVCAIVSPAIHNTALVPIAVGTGYWLFARRYLLNSLDGHCRMEFDMSLSVFTPAQDDRSLRVTRLVSSCLKGLLISLLS